jgi:hypothetical protein
MGDEHGKRSSRSPPRTCSEPLCVAFTRPRAWESRSPGVHLRLHCGHIVLISSCHDTKVEMGMAACKRHGALTQQSPPVRSSRPRARSGRHLPHLHFVDLGWSLSHLPPITRHLRRFIRLLDAGRLLGLPSVHVQSA